MDAEIVFFHGDIRPYPRQQRLFADNLGRMLNQNQQDIERPVAKADGRACLLEQPVRWK
ncbi:MAG: hypothetical protein WDN69_22160 [Aliidongia sp.]